LCILLALIVVRSALSSFFLFNTSHSPRFHAPQRATSPSFRFDASYSPSEYIASPFLCFDDFRSLCLFVSDLLSHWLTLACCWHALRLRLRHRPSNVFHCSH
jgi:hypothetical protein